MRDIDPGKYASTRNFANGALTYLSPYISRGVLSTKQVYRHIRSMGLSWSTCEKLIQELTWRDYWQEVWKAKGDAISKDLKNTQQRVSNFEIPRAILEANTGIEAVDRGIETLYETGYMHNHMRMYVAAIACNIAQSHWYQPAQWMYSHLLDGDLASNFLSWQWVAGAFSQKKYYANQENINRYFKSDQRGTFLDVDYEAFESLNIPKALKSTMPFETVTPLPDLPTPDIKPDQDTLVFNYYNLDTFWHAEEDMQRILLLEPAFFKKYPVSGKCVDFVLELSKNIEGIQIFNGTFEELSDRVTHADIYYKEHPTSRHYSGVEEARDSISSVEGYHPSFFSFWKKVKKEIEW